MAKKQPQKQTPMKHERPRRSTEEMLRYAPKPAQGLKVRPDGAIVEVKRSARGSAAMTTEQLEAAHAEKVRRQATYVKKARTPRVKVEGGDANSKGKGKQGQKGKKK